MLFWSKPKLEGHANNMILQLDLGFLLSHIVGNLVLYTVHCTVYSGQYVQVFKKVFLT
jgi:hypothetical protein